MSRYVMCMSILNKTNATGPSGRARLLVAAKDQLFEFPPSEAGVRKLARRAGVHHTFIAQSFGGLQSVLSEAYRLSFEDFKSVLNTSRWPEQQSLPGSDHAFWRIYANRVLDGTSSAEIVSDEYADPILLLAAKISDFRPKLDVKKCHLLALASWNIHLGSYLFRHILARGLGVELDKTNKMMTQVSGLTSMMCMTQNFSIAARKTATKQLDLEADYFQTAAVNGGEGQLVKAAIRILLENSSQNISGRELAKTAGVNYGLIHHHFGSKQSVFDAAFKTLHSSYVNDMVDADSQRLSEPFSLLAHSGFVQAWARRELAGIDTPDVPFTGMAKTLDLLRPTVSTSDITEDSIKAKAWCLVSFQLGYAVYQIDQDKNLRLDTVAGLRTIYDVLLSRWRKPS